MDTPGRDIKELSLLCPSLMVADAPLLLLLGQKPFQGKTLLYAALYSPAFKVIITVSCLGLGLTNIW
jgi:hypothetical protein